MAVINIEKDMPESCSMCDHRTVCTVFGKGWADANNRYSLGVYCRLDDCPLKSIEGLIERIQESKINVDLDIGQEMYYNNAVDNIIEIIKEYCGGEG